MSIVGGVAELPFVETAGGPVAGAGLFRFLESLAEEVRDRDLGAYGAPMTGTAQFFAKIEQVARHDVETTLKGTAVVAQAEADLE